MKRYEAYKPSNLPWVAEIPSGWKISKNSQLFRESSELSEKGEEPLLSLSQYTGISYKSNAAKIGMREADSKIGYRVIHEDDIVMNIMLAWNGSTAVSPFDGIISPAYAVYRQRTALNPKYFHYLFRIPAICSYFESNSTGLIKSRLRLYSDSFMRLFSIFPPREEQDQIVRYLDWQVSKINRLIAAKRKRIELVKEHFSVRIANIVCNGLKPNTPMRETGIDYIGAIPSHWTVLQNKRLFKSMNRTFQGIPTVLSLSQKDGLIPYSEMTERSLHTSSYESWQLVCPNDLVLNRFKAHLGVFFASKYTGIVTFHYGVYEAKMPLVAKYYEVLYHTPEYCRVYAGQSRGMTVGLQNLSDTNFYSTYTVYPPNEEQREIVTEIEQIEKQQSSIIAGVNRQIEKLQEFRTRLISDVVTGQVDVRGIKVPDDEYINNEITEEEFEEESENNEEE